jgi:hypothetical protein
MKPIINNEKITNIEIATHNDSVKVCSSNLIKQNIRSPNALSDAFSRLLATGSDIIVITNVPMLSNYGGNQLLTRDILYIFDIISDKPGEWNGSLSVSSDENSQFGSFIAFNSKYRLVRSIVTRSGGNTDKLDAFSVIVDDLVHKSRFTISSFNLPEVWTNKKPLSDLMGDFLDEWDTTKNYDSTTRYHLLSGGFPDNRWYERRYNMYNKYVHDKNNKSLHDYFLITTTYGNEKHTTFAVPETHHIKLTPFTVYNGVPDIQTFEYVSNITDRKTDSFGTFNHTTFNYNT